MSLEGRVALVTGASRGIGAAIAGRLAAGGADVAVGYGRDADAAEEVVAGIVASGRGAVAVGGDVADPAGLERMAEAAEAELGPIDILVSNAGIAPRQDLEEITVEDWDRVMNVNLRPAFLLARRLTPGSGGGGGWSLSPRSRPLPAGSWDRTTRLRRPPSSASHAL